MSTITSTSCGTSNIVQGAQTAPNNSYYLNSNPSGFIRLSDLDGKLVTQQDSLPSGASLYRISFPSVLTAAPSTVLTQLLNAVSGVSSYTSIVKSIDTSGFYVEFSNTLGTGYSVMSNYVSGNNIVGAFLETSDSNGIIVHQRDALTSGSNNYRINFPGVILAPTALSTELLNTVSGSNLYDSIIRNIDTSGFNIEFSNILGTGYYLMSTYLSGNSGIVAVNSYVTNITNGNGTGITSLNSLTGAVTLIGINNTISLSGNNIVISGSASGSSAVDSSTFVHTTGAESITGIKTFNSQIRVPSIADNVSGNTNIVLDCLLRTLYDVAGNDSVHFGQRELHAENETPSVGWDSRWLSGDWKTNTNPTISGHIVNKGYLDIITGQIVIASTDLSNVVFVTGLQNIGGKKGFLDLLTVYSGLTITDNSLAPILNINSQSGTFKLYYPNSSTVFMDNSGVFRSALSSIILNVNSGALYDNSLNVALDWDDRQLSGQWQSNVNPSVSGHIINKGYLDIITGRLQPSGASASVTNVVYTTGDQTVSGVKTFSNTGINLSLFSGNLNNYQQINVINKSSSGLSSADLVATNDIGNETTGYINVGINSSNYTGGYVGNSGDAYLYSVGNDLLIGNVVSGKKLLLFAEQTSTGTGTSTIAITNRKVQVYGSGDFSQALTVSNIPVITGIAGGTGVSIINNAGSVIINTQNDYDQIILSNRIFN